MSAAAAFASCAVYLAASAAAILLARRLRPVARRAALVLLLLPLLPTGRALLTGRYFGPLNLSATTAPLKALGAPDLTRQYRNGLLSDVQAQMVPWQAAVRRDLAAGRWPLWNPSILCGDILAAAAQPAILHPNTWIGFLLPLPQARTFAAAFTFFLAGLLLYLFLADLGVSEPSALFGAAAWELSNAVVFWVGWPVASAFVPLPLVFLGARRIAAGDRGGFGALAAGFFLSLASGHPEGAFYVAAAGGAVFLAELRRSGRRWRAAGLAGAAGALALALNAPVLLPFAQAVPQSLEHVLRTKFPDLAPPGMAPFAKALAGAVFPGFYGRFAERHPAEPKMFFYGTFVYAGAIVWALAAAGGARRRRGRAGFVVLGAFALAVGCGAPGLTPLVRALPLFHIAALGYLTLIASCCLCALAALGLDRLVEAGEPRWLAPAAATAAVGAFWVTAWRSPRLRAQGVDPREFQQGAILFAGALLALAAVVTVARRRRALLPAAAIALLLAFRLAETPRLYPAFDAGLFYPRIPELSKLPPPSASPYRIVGLSWTLPANHAALYGLEDARGYEAMTNRRLVETFPLWCVRQPAWFNRVDDAARPFLSLLNVRYALADPRSPVPPGWRLLVRGRDCAVFENPSVLPRAFAPERVRYVPPGTYTPSQMMPQADFSRLAWIEDAPAPPGDRANGRAAVSVAEDGPDLLLSIVAQSPAWIVVSETAWKGWHARLSNGSELPLRYADHAFLAFRAPAGRSAVRLVYRPRSFDLGLALAAAALLCLAAIGWRYRMRREPGGQG